MTYERFASLYDHLMEDVPYEKWVKIVNEYRTKYQVQGNKLLDLACGTGELSYRFADHGYQVTGVDLSDNMLAIARQKIEAKGLDIPLFQQNMAELGTFDQFDIITIFCDSLNYLQSEEEVISTFEGAAENLNDNGLFLFDVHSEYKMEHIFADNTFTHIDDDIVYIWNCFPGEFPSSVEHELTFFMKDSGTVKYERIEEFHIQRTFPVHQYKSWLTHAGFETLHVLGDLEEQEPNDTTERILFVAKKK
jgi:SAM-dependent methyltransferase